ncbi:MAG: anaerobic ribonucleoside-triphosphate reductase, partial [Methanosarcinales archaeon]
MPKVRTTDGHLMDWNRDAIIKQLLKETKLCEKFYGIPAIDIKTAETVAIEAENRIKKMDLKFISGPLVREIVNVILLEIGKTEWRNICTRVGTPVYDAYQIDIGNGYGAKDNANLQNNAESSHKHKADKISKEQCLLLLPSKIADAHLNGDIHIHDLEYFSTRPFCQSWDLRYFFYYGLMPDGSGTKASVAGPAKKPEVAILHAVKALGSAQTNFSGGQGFYNFLTFLSPYLEGLSYKEIYQLMQMFVYEMSVDYDEPLFVLNSYNQLEFKKIGEFVDNIIDNSKNIVKLQHGTEIVYLEKENIKWKCFAFDRGTKKGITPEITAVIRHKSPEFIYELKTNSGRSVKVTGDHSVFTMDSSSGDIVPIKVTELQKGDYIAVPRSITFYDRVPKRLDARGEDIIPNISEMILKIEDLLNINNSKSPIAYLNSNNTTQESLKKLLKTYKQQVEMANKIDYYNAKELLKNLDNLVEGDVKLDKIIEIRKIKPTTPYVYDLSVRPNGNVVENFVGGMGGIYLHNTQMHVARGGQLVFSSVQLSPGVPKIWRDKPIVYKGKIWNGEQAPLRTYGEFEKEVRLAFKALMEVMLQGDYWGKPFNFPKPEISIEPDFMIEDEEFNKNNPDLPTYEELYTLAFELSAKYGTPYFDNLLPEYRGAGKGISCYQCLSKEESIPIIKSDGEMAIKKLSDLFAYGVAKNGVSIDPYGVEFAPLKTVHTYALNTEKLKTEIKSFKGVIRKPYKGKILRIITESGRQIKVTPDHKMLIVKNGTVVEQRAKKIKIGDYLPVMNNKTVSINLINGDLHILRVKKIQLEDYDDYVYSPLEVSQHHNFINLFGICTKNCCAYTFSSNRDYDNEFEDKMYFRNGKHFSMGGWQVVSLNCPRAAYKAHGDDKKLFEELKRLMDIAVEVFKVKRQWMQEIIKSKRMPFITMRPKDPITGDLGEIAVDLDGLVYTIGIVGINEMVQHHCGYQMHESKSAWKLAIRAMTEMELYAKELSNKHNMEIALARTPAESLPSDEFVWIKENNIIKRVQIGNIVDKYMELYSDNIEVIDNSMILDLSKLNIDLKTIAFNENYKMEEAKITKLIKHGPNEIYKIRTSHGVIRTTPCHSIFTVDCEGYPIPIRVSDLKIGDYIATPNSIDIPVDNDQINLYENMKHLPNLQIISDRIILENIYNSSGRNDVSKWILSNRKTSVKDTKSLWLNNGYLPVKMIQDCNLEIPKENRDLYLKVAYSDTLLPIYIEKHERLGTLLGYFISEGSVYITSGRRAIQISNNDINIINECKDIFQYYGIKVSVSRDKNGTYTLYASVSGHDFVCYGLQAIDNQGNKKIPNWLFNAPLDVVISFIKSYNKGDGSIYCNSNRHDRTFKISTTNEDFANDISFLLRRIKVAPRITIRKRNNCSSGYEYTISVSGNDDLVRLKELGFDVTTGQKDTSDMLPKAKSLVYKLKNDLKLSRSQFTKLFECSDWMINAYYNKS